MSTQAFVDLLALENNLRVIREAAGGAMLLPMVKANAYGHGLELVASHLDALPDSGIAGFGVARVEEGVALRQCGITRRIVAFGGVTDESADLCVKHQLEQVVHCAHDVRTCARAVDRWAQRDKPQGNTDPNRGTLAVHVELDTGMTRLGCAPREWASLLDEVVPSPQLRGAGVMTHFAASGDDLEWTRAQLDAFERACDQASFGVKHACNSAAIFRLPDATLDWVRPGLALYGAKPYAGFCGDLKPVLRVHSRIIALRHVPANTPVSYGGTYRTARPSVIATVGVGYGDGLMRAVSGQGSMLVRGRRCPIRGVVCMDSTMIDVTDVPAVALHDEVVVLGEQAILPHAQAARERIDADDLASWAGTISYEVLTNWSARVPRVSSGVVTDTQRRHTGGGAPS
jgi:alanine racemase